MDIFGIAVMVSLFLSLSMDYVIEQSQEHYEITTTIIPIL